MKLLLVGSEVYQSGFSDYHFQAMRVCCQDMFFSRSRSTPAGHQLLNIPSSNGSLGTPLEHVFRLMKKPTSKLHAVNELLDTKVKDPVQQDFSSEVLFVDNVVVL